MLNCIVLIAFSFNFEEGLLKLEHAILSKPQFLLQYREAVQKSRFFSFVPRLSGRTLSNCQSFPVFTHNLSS